MELTFFIQWHRKEPKGRLFAGLQAMHLEGVAFCNTFATPSLKK